MQTILFAEATTEKTTWENFLDQCITWLTTSGVKLLIGVIVLFVLFQIINSISKSIKKGMEKRNKDKTIIAVIYNIIRKGGKLILFILFLSYIGIDTAGIGSILASLTVAIGLAIQGSLSNLAGWFIIIVMRPFRLGDYVECQGISGTVEDIRIFYTHIVTVDNKVIMVPNGALANGNITNYSTKEFRRVDNLFSISYGDDATKAIQVIEQVISTLPQIQHTPEPFIKVSACAASSIDITSRVWVKNEDFWTVYFALISKVKEAFDQNKISVPYNQLDVHLISEK